MSSHLYGHAQIEHACFKPQIPTGFTPTKASGGCHFSAGMGNVPRAAVPGFPIVGTKGGRAGTAWVTKNVRLILATNAWAVAMTGGGDGRRSWISGRDSSSPNFRPRQIKIKTKVQTNPLPRIPGDGRAIALSALSLMAAFVAGDRRLRCRPDTRPIKQRELGSTY